MDNRRWKELPRRSSDEPFRAEIPEELSQEFLFRLAARIEDRLTRSAQAEPGALHRPRLRSRYIE